MRLPRRRVEAEIPTASMADIAFLLFLFFLVTAVLSASRGLDLTLPREVDEPQADVAEAVFIKINADSSILVDCEPMSLHEILGYLEPRLARDPQKPVILYTDPGAPYQAMLSVYDVVGAAQERAGLEVKTVSVPTQSEVEDYIELFGQNPFEAQCPGA